LDWQKFEEVEPDNVGNFQISKNMKTPRSQSIQILNALSKGRAITPIDALEKFGCLRLAARISDLRADGHQITTKIAKKNGKRFAQYSMP
jgi:hypothetical protein